jgi:hypothetical protein
MSEELKKVGTIKQFVLGLINSNWSEKEIIQAHLFILLAIGELENLIKK